MSAPSEVDPARSAVQRAAALIDIGRFEEAIALLARQPIAYDASCHLAHAHYRLGQHRPALAAAECAVTVNPDGEWAHRLRSVNLDGLGRHPEALAAAERAVALSPTGIAAMRTLVSAQLACKMVHAAHVTAARLLARAPDDASAHAASGRVSLADAGWWEAERCFRAALARDPQSYEYMNNLGLALQGQGRRQDAIDCFHRAAKLDPRGEIARRNLRGAVRGYLGGGGMFAALYGASVLARMGGTSAAIIAAGAVLFIYGVRRAGRIQSLPEPVRAFYRAERRRRFGPAAWLVTGIGALVIAVILFQVRNDPRHPVNDVLRMSGVAMLVAYGVFALVACVRRWAAARSK